MFNRIDRSLLTTKEEATFDGRMRLSRDGYEHIGRLPADVQQRLLAARRRTWLVGPAAILAVVIAAALTAGEELAAGIAVGGVIFGPAYLVGLNTLRAGFAFRRWAYDYLDEIGYRARTSFPGAERPQKVFVAGSGLAEDRDNNPVYWATGTYDPERYYRETQGMSPGMRDYVRDAYGDLDTYESNKPD